MGAVDADFATAALPVCVRWATLVPDAGTLHATMANTHAAAATMVVLGTLMLLFRITVTFPLITERASCGLALTLLPCRSKSFACPNLLLPTRMRS